MILDWRQQNKGQFFTALVFSSIKLCLFTSFCSACECLSLCLSVCHRLHCCHTPGVTRAPVTAGLVTPHPPGLRRTLSGRAGGDAWGRGCSAVTLPGQPAHKYKHTATQGWWWWWRQGKNVKRTIVLNFLLAILATVLVTGSLCQM